ncbi:MAG: hypothetical protein OXE52_20365 [Chloroflexi bacterium]|nr:hypothetical protein [Chloroflexota bacterium]
MPTAVIAPAAARKNRSKSELRQVIVQGRVNWRDMRDETQAEHEIAQGADRHAV